MASTINADDGVISGSAGVKTTADTTGTLNIQTNGVTAISISPTQVVTFPSTTSIGTLYFGAGTVTAPSISVTGDSNTGIYFPAADTIGFTEGGTEALRINSSAQVEFQDGTVSLPAITNSGDTNTGIFFPAADTIAFAEGGVEAMRLDASGNMGLGVTPSAWDSAYKAFESTNGNSLYFTSDTAALASNAFFDTNWKYKTTGAAGLCANTRGTFTWFTAPSGTAGNTISFTQAMTLTAAGNLGIGTSSPGVRLEIQTVGAGSVVDALSLYNPNSAGSAAGNRILFQNFNNANARTTYASIENYVSGNAAGNEFGILTFSTRNAGSLAERVRIEQTGIVTIQTVGSGSVVDALSLYNPNSAGGAAGNRIQFQNFNNANSRTTYASIENYVSGNAAGNEFGILTFSTRNAGSLAERARITAAGDMGIGTSSPEGILHVAKSNAGGVGPRLVIDNPAGSTLGNTAELTLLTDAGASATGVANVRIRGVNENVGNGAANIQFWTWNGSAEGERARITSGGDLCVGATSSSGYRLFVQSGGVNGLSVRSNEATPGNGQTLYVSSNTANNYAMLLGISDTNSYTYLSSFKENTGAAGQMRFYSYQTLNGYYNTSGNWYKGDNTTTWSTTSDERIKENIQSLDSGLNVITSLRPVEFDYKRNKKHAAGFIAQEYETVLPEQVYEDRPIEDDQPYIEDGKVKVISQNLVPYLVKAIQEQQAMIDELKAKVAVLEGAN